MRRFGVITDTAVGNCPPPCSLPAMATEVAPGVYRLGSDMINWYLVVDDGKVTVVDAGVPRYWPPFDEALGEIGRSRDDVAALILTHGDGDHVGVAERIRSELNVPVYLHAAD